MFEFVTLQPQPMLAYLEQYLDDWHWCHATDVVTMIALTPQQQWPLWDQRSLGSEPMNNRLISCLNRWRAFRTSRVLHFKPSNLLRLQLPKFIAEIQSLPGARQCLSDVPESDVRLFATSLTQSLRKFGSIVKETNSCVLPSKAAHFLLLGLIPAFDREVIQKNTLWWLAPCAADMRGYVLLCWWVLQKFREEGTLNEARGAVAEYMLSRPMAWTNGLPRPGWDHWLLRSMDSVVAEYTLIQMARNAEQRYVLRWAAPATAAR